MTDPTNPAAHSRQASTNEEATMTDEGSHKAEFTRRFGNYDGYRSDAAQADLLRVFASGAQWGRSQMADRAEAAEAKAQRFAQALAGAAKESNAAMSKLAKRLQESETALDRVRRRHPRGDEEPGALAPGEWCPGCGMARSDGGMGACPVRAALAGEEGQR